MTTQNNGKTIALVVLVLIIALFAFRSIFFVLPFGLFPGVSHAIRDAGHSVWSFTDFGGFRFIPLMILPIALFALWIFVLFWVYRDAESRGMSGILWTLLVLIGNVVGLIIYLIVRNESGGRAQARPGEKCPSCGNPVASGFTYCPHCGSMLKPVCPSCHKPIDRSWKVCPNCGASLNAGKPEQA
jgi:hypothetical protein